MRAGERGQLRAAARAQAMRPPCLVHVQRVRADQFGQLAGGRAAQQIHFEEAFLRVHVAERAHRIGLVGGIDGDHAQRVALDACRCAQAL
ncbi:hypothetical protein NB705_002711 [Xanthomonas sacchari]|nr:hypothetical protein [Xanthomonas sacchari]